MDNNMMNEKDLEQVSGGQADSVLRPMADFNAGQEMTSGGEFLRLTCDKCGYGFPLHRSLAGSQVTCNACGNVFTAE